VIFGAVLSSVPVALTTTSPAIPWPPAVPWLVQ